MSLSMAKVWARKINAGTKTLEDVYNKYGAEGVDQVREAYLLLYGIELDPIN